MNADFLKDFDFFAGVPDSLLKPFCSYLMTRYGIDPKHHVIAANEGGAVGLAAGYHLATGRVPVVYMQNSGEGNAINPIASLLNDKVYAIPCVFVIGWRGEPGVPDEPQHIFQGEITLALLKTLDIAYFVIDKDTTKDEVLAKLAEWAPLLRGGKQVAFVVRKGALTYDGKVKYQNDNVMSREEILSHIVDHARESVIVSTTGKASRELFELREARKEGHDRDFLTVGSMGHSSMIALGLAAQKPNAKVILVDGDGAALMHMGGMALLGANAPSNVIHILMNNGAHETVGGMPTVAGRIDPVAIAKGCGYPRACTVSTPEELDTALKEAMASEELCFLSVDCSIGSREDLGRPTTAARQNKEAFMAYVKGF